MKDTRLAINPKFIKALTAKQEAITHRFLLPYSPEKKRHFPVTTWCRQGNFVSSLGPQKQLVSVVSTFSLVLHIIHLNLVNLYGKSPREVQSENMGRKNKQIPTVYQEACQKLNFLHQVGVEFHLAGR